MFQQSHSFNDKDNLNMLHETISVFVKGDCQIVNISQGKGWLAPIVTFVAENIVGILSHLLPTIRYIYTESAHPFGHHRILKVDLVDFQDNFGWKFRCVKHFLETLPATD
jgi:hypothetical protein